MKALNDVETKVEDEASKLKEQLLNPSNNLHTPIVEATIAVTHGVEDAALVVDTVKVDAQFELDKLAGKIGFPGGGV